MPQFDINLYPLRDLNLYLWGIVDKNDKLTDLGLKLTIPLLRDIKKDKYLEHSINLLANSESQSMRILSEKYHLFLTNITTSTNHISQSYNHNNYITTITFNNQIPLSAEITFNDQNIGEIEFDESGQIMSAFFGYTVKDFTSETYHSYDFNSIIDNGLFTKIAPDLIQYLPSELKESSALDNIQNF